jgi:2,3-bisphosphoglycerate-dependent phosphoglycerate mutase
MSASEEVAQTRLVLIRHGESIVSVDRVIGGSRTCTGLSELGRMQAARLRDRLTETGELRPDVLISSHYARAIETAEILAPALGGLEVVVDEGFGEHDPGPELDGMPFDEYIDRFGMPDWSGDPHRELFACGETTAEFHLRVGAALSRALRQHAGGTIVASCHGGVVDAAFRQLLNTPPTGAFALYTLNTSITEFSRPSEGHMVLLRYNDAAHLAGLPAETPRRGG